MVARHTLRTVYSHVMRVDYAAIPAPDDAEISRLAELVETGSLGLSDAVTRLLPLAVRTTGVANLSYQLFTGATPRLEGLDYLVAPAGENPNNLNAAYYQAFNLENRYINFAVNLGKHGEGAARFAAGYDGLTLPQAAAKAYAEIFGQPPSAEKIAQLLGDEVPDGRGGTFTRATYFAELGQDGPAGPGTKAALVGWLLAEAAKAGVGPLVTAHDAFLVDLALDGLASFNVDLLDAYGPQQDHPLGVIIGLRDGLSATPTQSDPSLRTTAGNDAILSVSGLSAAQSVVAGEGADRIEITGVAAGSIDAGGGDDRVEVGALVRLDVLGAPESGRVRAGSGNDSITAISGLGGGVLVDGGPGDDQLTALILNPAAEVASVEHVFITGTAAFGPPPADLRFVPATFDVNLARLAGVQDIWNISQGFSGLNLTGATSRVITGLRDTSGSLRVEYAAGTRDAHVFLDNVADPRLAGGGFSNALLVYNLAETLRVHVSRDSSVGEVLHRDGREILIDGLGAFRAMAVGIGLPLAGFPPFDGAPGVTHRLDASGAAAVEIGSFAPSAMDNVVILSEGNDVLGAYLYAQVRASFTLGGGADLLKITSAAPPNASGLVAALANLRVVEGQVDTYATVTDFQKGVDRIDLGALISQVAAMSPPGGAGTLAEALTAVSGGLAAGGTAVFEFGGDTWVYRQDATVGVNSGDGLVRLVGVTGLSLGTGPGSFDIHYGA